MDLEGFPPDVHISPLDWPAGCRNIRPGDLELFMPQGFGLGSPPVVTPYGGAPEQSYYAFQGAQTHPFLNGPLTEASGGTLYFDDDVSPQALEETLGVMGVFATPEYVAYGRSSSEPIAERYLDQMRLVSHSALSALFGAAMPQDAPRQTLHAAAAVCSFVSTQKSKWNDRYAFSAKLSGTAGGDGDWAKESLAFGFHVENTYWGVYRVWSRPWLVTK